MNRIVVPGEMLSDKPLRIENAIVQNNKTYATLLSLYDEEKGSLIPLEGLWYPRHGDNVIGIVEEAKLSTYTIDLNAPYKGLIIAKFSETKFMRGDIVEAMVKDLDSTKTVVLMRPRRLFGGKIVDVKPSKIPRIIGRNSVMIRQLTEGTKATITIGMNGRIWIKGGDVALATEAILKIQEEAHTSGLTERIKELLSKANKV